MGPMSGEQASTGVDMLRGAQLAAARLNTHGGVLGRRVELVAGDDRADPATGATVARGLVRKGVSAVIGPFNSAVGLRALPIFRAAGLPVLRLTSAAATEGFGVTTQPMVGQIAPVEEADLTSVLHARSVAVLYDPSTYTAAIATQLAGGLRGAGVSVPVDAVLDPQASTAQIDQALTAVAAARPAVTYLAMYGPEAGMIAARMLAAPKLRHALLHTRAFRGVTGTTTIAAPSGNRVDPPVVILDIDAAGQYTIDPAWATFARYPA
jgi:ABC-type branched-subunit amino acid transport system substrate-binding protein